MTDSGLPAMVSAPSNGPASSEPSIPLTPWPPSVERLNWDLMERITARIAVEVTGINRVLVDITPKPTGIIEWE